MTDIVVDASVAQACVAAGGQVRLVDPDGRILGVLTPPQAEVFSAEEIKAAYERRNSPGPWYTTAQVMDKLRSLEAK